MSMLHKVLKIIDLKDLCALAHKYNMPTLDQTRVDIEYSLLNTGNDSAVGLDAAGCVLRSIVEE